MKQVDKQMQKNENAQNKQIEIKNVEKTTEIHHNTPSDLKIPLKSHRTEELHKLIHDLDKNLEAENKKQSNDSNSLVTPIISKLTVTSTEKPFNNEIDSKDNETKRQTYNEVFKPINPKPHESQMEYTLSQAILKHAKNCVDEQKRQEKIANITKAVKDTRSKKSVKKIVPKLKDKKPVIVVKAAKPKETVQKLEEETKKGSNAVKIITDFPEEIAEIFPFLMDKKPVNVDPSKDQYLNSRISRLIN